MDAGTNEQLVMDAWRAFATQDPDRVRAVFTPDAEWLAPARNATALALDGSHHLVGRERIVRFLAQEFGSVFVADVTVEFRGVHAAGDTVVVEERMQATLANGAHYDNEYCLVFELAGGRIHRVREYMDTQRGAECFAAVPAAAERDGGRLTAVGEGSAGAPTAR
jgi:ketosteroid isomerase-like protein